MFGYSQTISFLNQILDRMISDWYISSIIYNTCLNRYLEQFSSIHTMKPWSFFIFTLSLVFHGSIMCTTQKHFWMSLDWKKPLMQIYFLKLSISRNSGMLLPKFTLVFDILSYFLYCKRTGSLITLYKAKMECRLNSSYLSYYFI